MLGWFFEGRQTISRSSEALKSKEPEVWVGIGSPAVLDVLALLFARFRKY